MLCVDEKSQIQALDRSAPVLPMMPGMPERRTHDYARFRGHHPVRRAGRGQRTDHRLAAPPTQGNRVQEVLGHDRCPSSCRKLDVHLICDNLSHPQDPDHRQVAGGFPALPAALPPDQLVLEQPGRHAGSASHRQTATPRRAQVRSHIGERDIAPGSTTGTRTPQPFVWIQGPPTRSSSGSAHIFNGFPARRAAPRHIRGAGQPCARSSISQAWSRACHAMRRAA